MRMLSIGVDTFAASAAFVPYFLILQTMFWKERKKSEKIGMLLMAIYFVVVFSVTGLPRITEIGVEQVDLNLNLKPFSFLFDGPTAIINMILNIFMFVPFGVLFPIAWKRLDMHKAGRLRSFIGTTAAGCVFSVWIECLQIFTFRATDIDDVIANTTGAALGWMIYRINQKRKAVCPCTDEEEEVHVQTRYISLQYIILLGIIYIAYSSVIARMVDSIWSMIL